MKNLIQYKGYYGSYLLDLESQVFYGKVEFLKALISYEANTAKALKKAFEEAVDDYLNVCKEKNITPEKPFKGSFNIRLNPELHRQLVLTAAKHHQSLNQFIRTTLENTITANSTLNAK